MANQSLVTPSLWSRDTTGRDKAMGLLQEKLAEGTKERQDAVDARQAAARAGAGACLSVRYDSIAQLLWCVIFGALRFE